MIGQNIKPKDIEISLKLFQIVVLFLWINPCCVLMNSLINISDVTDCCGVISRILSAIATSVSCSASSWLWRRYCLIERKHISQLLKSGEYLGRQISRIPNWANMFRRITSTKQAWWKPQLSMITQSPRSRTALPSVRCNSTASSKKIINSMPLEGSFKMLKKSTPLIECKRFSKIGIRCVFLNLKWRLTYRRATIVSIS